MMCSTAVRSAAQYTQRLARQGKSRRAALQHAAFRFGVTQGAIIREIHSWHDFKLPDIEPESVPRNPHPEDADYFARLHATVAARGA